MRAGVYVRISSDPDQARAGVERQRQDCVAHCEGRGWEVVGVYEDNDISAYSGKARPAYRRLLEDLKAGTIDAVVAWHPDRLHRSPRELEEFIDVVESTGAAVSRPTWIVGVLDALSQPAAWASPSEANHRSPRAGLTNTAKEKGSLGR